MAFIETPVFPKCVALGALSKPRYKTTVIPTLSGYTDRNVEWAQPLHSFDFAKVMTQEQHDSLLEFFHAAQGRGHEFRVRDPGDFDTTISNGVLLGLAANQTLVAAGSFGYGYGRLLAGKKYAAGARITYRGLQKLVNGSVTVYRGGVPVVEGVNPGQIAIDETTGLIEFEPDDEEALSGHTPGAQHIVSTATAFSPAFVVGDRIYLTGITGTAGAVLNDYSWEITNISGSDYTIDVDTTGLTASGGTGRMFPQPDESLTLVCEFDVPCAFSSDEAGFELIQKNSRGEFYYQWAGINLEEVRLALP